jgi:integrase
MARRARRGSGHLYRRGKVWWFKWYDANGVPQYQSSHLRDREAAETMLREQLNQRARGAPPLPDPWRVSVDVLLDNLLAEYRMQRRRSVDRVDLACRHLLRFFGGRAAASVRGVDIAKYVELRRADEAAPAPATINRELAALRRAYRLAVRDGLLTAMPIVQTLSEDNVRTGFIEAEQLEAISRRLTPDTADAVRFMYVTGWRSRSEVFPLTWPQVDWAGGLVRLEPGTTKNREGRAFPLTPALRAILERRLDVTKRCERAQGLIIPWVFHRGGQRIKTMAKSWATACLKAGLATAVKEIREGTRGKRLVTVKITPHRILHDFRRTAVRNLERAGVSRSVAMRMTGHKTESVYRRYAIVTESDLREAGAKLEALGMALGPVVTKNSDSFGAKR